MNSVEGTKCFQTASALNQHASSSSSSNIQDVAQNAKGQTCSSPHNKCNTQIHSQEVKHAAQDSICPSSSSTREVKHTASEPEGRRGSLGHKVSTLEEGMFTWSAADNTLNGPDHERGTS